MAPRTSAGRIPIPILDPVRERMATAPGEVKPYQLSPEELQELWERMGPPGTVNGKPGKKKQATMPMHTEIDVSTEKQRDRAKKSHAARESKYKITQEFIQTEFAKGKTAAQIEIEQGMKKNTLFSYLKKWGIRSPHSNQYIKPKEEIPVLTKEGYLQLRLNGQNRTSIGKIYFPNNPPKFYAQLTEWGIKEQDAEERALDLFAAEQEAAKGVTAVEAKKQEPTKEEADDALNEAKSSIAAEIDKQKAKDTEIGWLREEISRWKDDCRELSQEIIDKEKELGEMVEQVEQLRKARTESYESTHDLTMALDTYQDLAERTANADWDAIAVRVLRHKDALPMLNFALGAAGEAGEIADEVKKAVFHGHDLDREHLAKEIGDTLWYLSQIARLIDCSFSEIAERNIAKLKERYPEGFSEEQSRERD